MEIKHCYLKKLGNEPIKLWATDMEKPKFTNVGLDNNIDWEQEKSFFEGLKNQWQQSFREYPVKDEKAWFDLFGKMIAQRNEQFKTERAFSEILRNEGIEIDHSLIEIKTMWCMKEAKQVEVATISQATIKESVQVENHEDIDEIKLAWEKSKRYVIELELSLLEARKFISENHHSDFWKTDVGIKICSPIKNIKYTDKY